MRCCTNISQNSSWCGNEGTFFVGPKRGRIYLFTGVCFSFFFIYIFVFSYVCYS